MSRVTTLDRGGLVNRTRPAAGTRGQGHRDPEAEKAIAELDLLAALLDSAGAFRGRQFVMDWMPWWVWCPYSEMWRRAWSRHIS